jgi:hypothetical protein
MIVHILDGLGFLIADWSTIVGPGLVVLGSFWVIDRKEQRPRAALQRAVWAPREKRCGVLGQRADGRMRFAHRQIEKALLTNWRPRRGMRADSFSIQAALGPILSEAPPGLLVSMFGRPLHGQALPGVLEVPFEFIDGQDRYDTLRIIQLEEELRRRKWSSPDAKVFKEEGDAGESSQASFARGSAHEGRLRYIIRRLRALLKILAGLCLLLAIVGVLVGAPIYVAREILRGKLEYAFALLLAALFVGVPVFLSRILVYKRVWLVPGGLIWVRQSAFRRKGKALYARRNATPLAFNLKADNAYVRVGNHVRKIPFGWPHLIAWVASAPSPSVEAVQALVGEDVELTVAE